MIEEIAYMHIAILLAILIVSFIVCAIIWGEILVNSKKYLLLPVVIFSGIIVICTVWMIISISQPEIINFSTTHEIKDVIYPDGTKSQMFTCDNIHRNIVNTFPNRKSTIVDEKLWHVKRVRYASIYYGIKYIVNDRYFLERIP